ERETAGIEVEEREVDLARPGRGAERRVGPAEAAGDHEMDDEEQVAVEGEDESLAKMADGAHGAALGRFDRRIKRAEGERAPDEDASERGAEDAPTDRLDVDRDVRELGHPARIVAGTRGARAGCAVAAWVAGARPRRRTPSGNARRGGRYLAVYLPRESRLN